MKVTILGSGTPAPSLKRSSSGYAVECGDDLIIFDHGPGTHDRFLQAGYRAVDVSSVFLTHYHYDHFTDYPRLALTRWDQGAGRIPDLKVFGPPHLKHINNQLFGPEGVFALDLEARTTNIGSLAIYKQRGGQGERERLALDEREVVPGDKACGPNWQVTAGPARHLENMMCLSYRIEDGEHSVVYSGDNGGVYEPFIEFANGADVMIHMNHFLSGTELNQLFRETSGSHLDVATTAAKAGVNTVVLTHMLPLFDEPGIKERAVSEMKDIFDGNIIFGEDLMEIPLTGLKAIVPD